MLFNIVVYIIRRGLHLYIKSEAYSMDKKWKFSTFLCCTLSLLKNALPGINTLFFLFSAQKYLNLSMIA